MNKLDLINSLSKMFNYQDEDVKMPKNPFVVVDATNVLAVYGRTREIKKTIMLFANNEESKKNVKDAPVLDYLKKSELGSRFSIDYMKNIFDVFSSIDESPKIFCKKNYPIKIQSESIGFILAPRIEHDD